MTTESNKPKPGRRWLQFSLRTFFVVLTVACVWLGWTVHRANEQRKAVEWVREMGGSVLYDYEFGEDGHRIDDVEPPGPKWLVQLLGVDYFQEVLNVDLDRFPHLDSRPLTDVTPLAKLTSLRSLNLSETQVTDLTPLANLTSLQELYLNGTQISDLTPLEKMTSLEYLAVSDTRVS